MGIIFHKPGPRPKKKRIKKEPAEKREMRRKLSIDSNNRCVTCDRYAPFEDKDGQFDLYKCGHLSHIKTVGSGGDDVEENVLYECFECHEYRDKKIKVKK